MRRIGLTGGIGSGKSTVAGMLEARGAVIIDADAIARGLVEPGQPALVALVDEFGESILQPDGSLSRASLASLAFRDPGTTDRLNAIMHPLIAEESRRLMDSAPSDAVVVYDMPLLVETGQQSLVDMVVVVDVPEEMQVGRAVGMRGLDAEDVRRRMAVQATRDQRRAVADVVIENSGSLDETEAQVDRLWRTLDEASS